MSIQVTVVEDNVLILNINEGVPGVGVPVGGTTGQVLAKNSDTDYDTEWVNQSGGGGGGSGTVTSVSVVSANGLAGTVATATTTPAITISTSVTGVLKGNGTAISAAVSGTDYSAPGHTHTASNVTDFDSAARTAVITSSISNGDTTHSPSGDAVFDALALKSDTSHAHSASDVTSGTLVVARGGTNSGTSLNNNRIMQSSGGAIVEASAITASRILASDSNGIPVATSIASSALSGSNTGDQTITLTGDVSGSGTGSFAATIQSDVVDNTKLANVPTSTIKGRVTASTGDPQDLTGTQATTLLDVFSSSLKGLAPSSGGGTTNFLRADGSWAAPADTGITTLNTLTATTQTFATGSSGSDFGISSSSSTHTFNIPDAGASARGLVTTGTQTIAGAKTFSGAISASNLSGTNTGDQTITLTSDVTGSGTGSFAATIAPDAVTNAKLANVATQTFKGRTTASTGDPEDLTATQATAILNNFVGDSGSGGTKGLVPAPSAGDAAAAKFLKADGTWTAPSGTGDVSGPGSSTDNAFTRFDGTTGKVIQNSSATLDDTGKGTFVGLLDSTLTASRAMVTDGSKNHVSSATTAAELAHVSGVTSAIQTQIDGKISTTLTDGNILVGNGSNVATSVNPSGDIDISNAGVFSISSGAIVNTDVNASAAIAGSKISPDFGSQNITTTGTANAASNKSSGTGGAGYFEVVEQSSAPSTPTNATRIYVDGSNRLSWIGENGFVRTFDGTANTASRVYVLPDASTTMVGTDATQTLTNKSIVATQLTGTLQAGQFPALTGDVTTSAGNLATTIPNGTVTYAKMQTFGANKMIANNTGSAAAPAEFTFKQVAAATYSGTIAWTGTTAPSGATQHQFNWMQIGSMVTVTVSLEYATAGSALQQVKFDLPSGVPTPAAISGLTSAGEVTLPATAVSVSTSTTGTPVAVRGALQVNAGANGFEFIVTTASNATILTQVTCTYMT